MPSKGAYFTSSNGHQAVPKEGDGERPTEPHATPVESQGFLAPRTQGFRVSYWQLAALVNG